MAEKPLTTGQVLVGGTRAALGQGLGMGWGDEAEAWLRSRLGEQSYEDALKQVRGEYGRFSQQYPFTAGASEFAGGMIPGAVAMLIPGAQTVGTAQAQRSAMGALAKLGALGATTGAVSGAGYADEGDRAAGALAGSVMGGVLGAATPPALRGIQGAAGWLRSRLFPTEASATKRATQLVAESAARTGMTPQQIEAAVARDRAMGVPATVANVAPALERRARGVAKTGGTGSERITEVMGAQKTGSATLPGAPERVMEQVTRALQPGDYFDDLAALRQTMRTKAAPYYDAAYAYGEVADPDVLKFLELPQFKQGVQEAKKLLAAEGRELPMAKVVDPVSGETVERLAPTVEVLDQVKRGLDALIEKETDALTGKTSSLGRIYVQKKNEFLDALDQAVPEYAQARAVYRGDAEVMDAMRAGMEKFPRMKHEEVAALVRGFSDAEKEAFKTGVARNLYSVAMEPKTSVDTAGRIIGSREMQDKLRPLFDSDAQFDLFKSALVRESQLFKTASRVLGGSDTAENLQMIREINEEGGGWLMDTLESMATGTGWGRSIANSALRFMNKAQVNDKTAAKMADMLMSSDPADVAAVVRALENFNQRAVPQARRASATEAGTATALPTAIYSPPGEEAAIREAMGEEIKPAMQSAIEDAIEADRRRALGDLR